MLRLVDSGLGPHIHQLIGSQQHHVHVNAHMHITIESLISQQTQKPKTESHIIVNVNPSEPGEKLSSSVEDHFMEFSGIVTD